jgi:AcrR family transcriptional regulator
MPEQEASNREKIIRTAVALFAERGFSAVSQREIAATIGIKAASIYNHFSSKDAILEEIIKRLSRELEEQLRPAYEPKTLIPLRAYVEGISNASDAYFAADANRNLGMILMREQFSNAVVRKMLYEMMILRPRESMSVYFAKLMDVGMMRAGDPMFAAKEYHSFFVYEFYESALSVDLRPGSGEISFAGIMHLDRFVEFWSL